ncbi:MAG TPA: hypothetical protein VI365_00250, partial [Trebonia sp.]
FILEGERDTYLHRLAFEALTDSSLSREKSRELITATAEELWAPEGRLGYKAPGEEWPPNRPPVYLATQTSGYVGKGQDRVPLIRENTAVGSLMEAESESADLADPDLLAGFKSARPRADEKLPAVPQSSLLGQMEDEIGVSIYLDTDDADTIARVILHVDELVEALGYDGPIDPAVERGSFIRNSWAKIKRSLTSEDVKEILIKAQRAAELRCLDAQQAEVDNKIADTLGKVIDSLSDVPSACIQAGSILIVKYSGPQGPVLMVRSLSQLEVRALERFPEIQREPQKTLESLALTVSNLIDPEPQQGSL